MLGLVGRTIGRYHILEQVGQGGMSSVFRAVEPDTNRTVALKIISPYLANEPQFQARFEREVRLLLRLQHPTIIPILDFGQADGLAYIVMPFIATGTLHERLQAGPLDPIRGGRIIDQIAAALTRAHEDGVIHRDVKPSNVLLDQEGNAILTDFGFARPQVTSQNLTGSALIGTPAYMSPEQCRGDPLDARSDQYSFAVMLYQITTGQLPFEGETPMAIAMKHVSVPLPPPRAISPSLPEGLEMVLVRALAKDPALRFPSVKDLNQAFQSELKAALDPKDHRTNASTMRMDRTVELYRRYQNVKAPPRRAQANRPTLLALLLLLLACVVSAGAVGIIYPEWLRPVSAAPAMSPFDIQATVDVILTANAPAQGTQLAPGALETSVYAAVLQTLQASQAPDDGGQSSTRDTPTEGVAEGVLLPTGEPSATEKPPTATPSRTAVPSATPKATETAPGPAPTLAAASSTAPGPTSSSPTPSATSTSSPPSPTPTSTPAGPTETATAVPPTNTPPPPTPTPLLCEWSTDGVNIHGDTVSVAIRNTGDLTLRISSVGITWTDHHETLLSVRLMGEIWSGWAHGPSFSVGTDKNIGAGNTRTLYFEFSGYHFDGSASVDVQGGC